MKLILTTILTLSPLAFAGTTGNGSDRAASKNKSTKASCNADCQAIINALKTPGASVSFSEGPRTNANGGNMGSANNNGAGGQQGGPGGGIGSGNATGGPGYGTAN